MSNNANEQIAYLIKSWRKDHVLGFESLFGVTLDDQQKSLVRAAQGQRARVAVKSGTGCGKTFCLAGLTFLYLLIYPNVRIMTSSPSYNQLSRVYRTEVDLLFNKMNPIFQQFFPEQSRLKERICLDIKGEDPRVCDLVTANPGNLENLAGGHAGSASDVEKHRGEYIVLMDEGSGVDDEVYKTLIRTLTTDNTKFIITSNPTRNQGFYYDIFQKELENWDRITFNGFDSAHVSEKWIEEMAQTYGVESDTYKIGVLGQFGRIGEDSFFPAHLVEEAIKRRPHRSEYASYPRITGVDVAGAGKDFTVFLTRQGAEVIDVEKHRGLDPMEVVAALVSYRSRIMPHQIYVDATGLGAGVGPRCRELGLQCQDVLVGTRSPNPQAYFNLRAWLYGEVRNWLADGGSIPDDDELRDGLLNCKYTHSARMAIQIIAKHIMKNRGFASPDELDALALTFVDNIYMQASVNVRPREIVAPKYLWA